MALLAFETSCDETSAAVIHRGRVLSNVVSSQVRMHAEYGGVVPELAAREHLRNFLPVAASALAQARITADQLEAVAATQGPGLPSALMVGFYAGTAAAFALQRPFIGINHHEAHLYSPWIRSAPLVADFSDFQPNIALVVSGGHTLLVHVQAESVHRLLGSTIDDAAGECFDKIGKLLGLPYPAGTHIDRLAEGGNPRAFDFPRPMMTDPNHDFSFSGLKTSVRYFLRDHPQAGQSEQGLRDLCASVQAAIVETLVVKTMRAAKKLRVRCVTASGGVSCNRALRRDLANACARESFILRVAEPSLCTDNAAMIGVLAERKLALHLCRGAAEHDVRPNWELGDE